MGEQFVYTGLFALEYLQAVGGIAELDNAQNEGKQDGNNEIDEDSCCADGVGSGIIGIISAGFHHDPHCEGAGNAENGGYEVEHHLGGNLNRHEGEGREHGMGICHAHRVFGILFE